MDAITHDTTLPSLEQTFTVATELVTSALGNGITPSGATLKLHMRREISGFDERAYGFSRFLKYLEAAERAGHLKLGRDPDGQPRVSLPSSVTMVPASTAASPHRRLRPDLWMALVSWDTPAARYWDRVTHRSHLVPLDEQGRPLWESQPARFAPLKAVSRDVHIGWMHDFVNRLDDGNSKLDLEAALSPLATPGSFKRALSKHSLGGEWQALLTTCVMNQVLLWATEESVAVSSILEPRRKARPVEAAATPSAPAESPASAPSQETRLDETDSLRAILHSVIDRMSLHELAALPIPASYLMQR